jgi:hypothetical protein
LAPAPLEIRYIFGREMYWELSDTKQWKGQLPKVRKFSAKALDLYCEIAEKELNVLWTFLLCWNRTTGVKDVGKMIAKELQKNLEKHRFSEPKKEETHTDQNPQCIIF